MKLTRLPIVPLILALLAGCSPEGNVTGPQLTEPDSTPTLEAPPSSEAAQEDEAPADEPVAKLPAGELSPAELSGIDWPSFLGPNRDSKSPETGLLETWPAEGPPIVWQRELGEGYGIGSTSEGRYFQFDRIGNEARLVALDAATGELLWEFTYPSLYSDLFGYDGGPRASPVIDGDRVYIYGVEGMLHCLDVTDGNVHWKLNVNRKFGVVQNFFGVGSTPLVEGDLLLVMVGGSPPESQAVALGALDEVESDGSGIVAFDKHHGGSQDVPRWVQSDTCLFGFNRISKINRGSLSVKAAALHQFERVPGTIDAAFAITRHVIGMGMRNKSMLGLGPAVIETNVQIGQQNTVVARLGNIHQVGC